MAFAFFVFALVGLARPLVLAFGASLEVSVQVFLFLFIIQCSSSLRMAFALALFAYLYEFVRPSLYVSDNDSFLDDLLDGIQVVGAFLLGLVGLGLRVASLVEMVEVVV